MNALFTDEVLTRSLLLFSMLGSVAGLFAGAALLCCPDWLLRVSKHANRWVSTRQVARPLARSIDLEGWLYCHNRPAGILLMSAAAYIIYYFTALFDKPVAMNSVFKSSIIPSVLMDGLIDALVLVSLIGAVFAVLISLFIVFRPSMLREFEQRANKRTSLRQGLKPLEILRGGVDHYVSKNVRLVGVLIFTGSFYTLVIMLGHWKSI